MTTQSTAVQRVHEGDTIIGFDLGHGESALMVQYLGSHIAPAPLNPKRPGSFVTAVSRWNDKLLIGYEAFMSKSATDHRAAFKSQQLDDPYVRDSVTLFVQGVLAHFGTEITSAKEIVVGCPSGWDAETRRKYIALLQEAGLPRLKLLPESRAAFLHARAMNPIMFDDATLVRSVLVIDIGSSTTDFTHVVALTETPVDFGHVELGASLIDKLLLERSVSRSGDKAAFERAFLIEPKLKTRCELYCRKAKEEFFSSTSRQAGDIKIVSDARLSLDTDITEAEMNEVLATPLPQLDNKSWPDAYRSTLERIRDSVRTNPPNAVIITGGASLMPFAQEITKEVFPSADVSAGKEPDVAIAKGLVLAARIDHDTAGFLHDVQSVLKSDRLGEVVRKHMPDLLVQVSDALAAPAVELLIAALENWRRGMFDTLHQASDASAAALAQWMHSDDGRARIRDKLEPWFTGLARDISNLTTPICNAYHLQPAALELPAQWAIGGQHIQHARLDKVLEGTLQETDPVLMGVIDLLAEVLGENILGIVFGAILVIVIALINAIASIFDTNLSKAIVDLSLPGWLRKRVPLDTLAAKLREQRAKVQEEICASLKKDSLVENVVKNVSATLADQIERRARGAQLLIRSGKSDS